MQTIVDESRRLQRLVENLLDMARLDSGAVVLNRQWHVLEEIVGLALADVKREIEGHTVRVQIPVEFPLLLVDAFFVEQLLVNLLENAVRYTPPNSQIEISASIADKFAEIRVADNGPGVPEGSDVRLFDKFVRGKSGAADGRRGVGLGLAICKGIVDAHGGSISAKNRPEGGAEFRVLLPCEATPPKIPVEELPNGAIV